MNEQVVCKDKWGIVNCLDSLKIKLGVFQTIKPKSESIFTQKHLKHIIELTGSI